ncbi:MAG: bacteriohemerythrin [Lachnospiraceae bacterium]|nr:bacteriohemerythrin [Lachnospiraceae bacterium]
MYQFTEDCLTGIEQIDNEHRYLFQLIHMTDELLKSDEDIRMTAMNLLKELKEYTQTHFTNEEAYMEKMKDPELPRQKEAHRAFIVRVEEFDVTKFDDAHLRTAVLSLLEYLSHWLFHHILGSDVFIGKFESPFAFTEKYHTGISLVDEEHEKLFEIIERANDLIHAEFLHDKYDRIVEILEELKEYTIFHFNDEEEYMKKIGYPMLEAQKTAHEGFVEELNAVKLEELDENQEEYLNHLLKFLLKWLSGHIMGMDKRIGEFERSDQ